MFKKILKKKMGYTNNLDNNNISNSDGGGVKIFKD